MQPFNPSNKVPDEFSILWDFSELVNGAPIGYLTRKKDKLTIPVLFDPEEPIEEDLNVLYPAEEEEEYPEF